MLNIRELESVTDDLLLPWLDLFETAFPPPERVLVSEILALLRDKAPGLVQSHHLLAALEPPGQFVGMAWYELWPKDVGLLGYIAVVPEKRGQGIGSRFYREIVKRISARVLFLEMEMPEEATSEQQRQFALRRIQFYRQLGALRLTGIHYLQTVGPHQPLTPMHLMVHPFEPIDALEVFELAQGVFGDLICQVGPLALE
jgi:ribosomal protein S18 acetylase RimI-like enzyme